MSPSNVSAMSKFVFSMDGANTFLCSFWLNAVVSPRNKIQFFFFPYYNAAQKLTRSQFSSKNALYEAISLKNGNFGTHYIVVSFLCFLHETQISF